MQTFTWQQIYCSVLLFLALLLTAVRLTQEPLFTPYAYAQSVTPQSTVVSGLAVTFADPELRPGQQSALTATLRDSAGQPVADQLVVFYGGLGTVSPASAVTDADGRVNAIYTAGSRGGHARVTVLAGYAAQSVPVQIVGTDNQPGGNYRLFLPAITR